MQQYTVKREHYGDRAYARGEIREAHPSDVAHLVQSGILEPVAAVEAVKADAAPLNKAVKAPKNKAR